MSITDETFQQWDTKLAESNFFGGDDPSAEDNENYKSLNGAEPNSTFANVWSWFLILNIFTEEVRSAWTAPKAKGGKKGKKEQKKEEKKEEADDDFDDMFGEDEDDAEAAAAAAQKAKDSAKKAKKPAPIAKSIILFEVKPWEAGQDLESLAQKILTIVQDGLLWKTETRTEAIGYGIFKLIVGCTVEDDKVSIDDLQEKISTDFEEFVQSVDILSFNKV
mmetsp:Transcript_3020/g.3587  ORF Transcript_3020/g.3587 Transcript_3020/m.3587 type:complete len:220 (+) Transcript_3020:31-690(+)|eukprot:CAMPEP_0205821352 /NCGR_PEP_ID=MMETSP0206-20130828/7092_1 /ASSEMBLY_ACC=CAM_ASM_000279 /TAXON_ID=36767 /ORGANISM="Euplotes focardii, Strain TN1" /LENGTH=219 /DNA_ID=CAMNT_0053116769 /DNA_START=23 /DNA_END=682 /DNA_ORIENTATION=+